MDQCPTVARRIGRVEPCLDNVELRHYPKLDVNRLFHAQRCFQCLCMIEELKKDSESFSRRDTNPCLPVYQPQ